MELTIDQRAELQAVVKSADVPAPVATRARLVNRFLQPFERGYPTKLSLTSAIHTRREIPTRD